MTDQQCRTGKVYFATSGRAAKAHTAVAKRRGKHDQQPYRCPECGGWHLGRRTAFNAGWKAREKRARAAQQVERRADL